MGSCSQTHALLSTNTDSGTHSEVDVILAERFKRRFAQADYGVPFPYYEGHLAVDRGPGSKDQRSSAQNEVHLLAECVRGLVDERRASVHQKRSPNAAGAWLYYCTKLK